MRENRLEDRVGVKSLWKVDEENLRERFFSSKCVHLIGCRKASIRL